MEQVRPDTRLLPTAQGEGGVSRPDARDAATARLLQQPTSAGSRAVEINEWAVEISSGAAQALSDFGFSSEVSNTVAEAIKDHRDTLIACITEVAEDDDTFNRHAQQGQATDENLRRAPCQSLADVRAKLTYLLPVIKPDMLDGTHVEQLLSLQSDMDRLCRDRSRPTDGHEDAELLRLGDQLDQLHARWRLLEWQKIEPQGRLYAAMNAARARGGPTADEVKAAWDLPGVTETHDAAEAAILDLDPIRDAIWSMPATTPAGLAVKARAALTCIWPNAEFERDAALGEDEDWIEQIARRLIESCCTLAGVDWRGDPIAPPVSDPVFSAIDRHLAARVACLGLDDGEDKEKYEAAHDQRRDALDAVEAIQPTTVAGLFALARHMDAYLTEDGEPPQDAASAQEQAFSGLIKACLGLHAARYPGMDRDWAQDAAYHPGFLPSPQHQPAGLLCLTAAIPLEAARLYDLAEAEFERRRQAYVGFHDPSVWPRVAADLRRDMRMDALALVARRAPRRSTSPAAGADPILAAIERHAAARAALDAASRAQDEVAVAERGGDTSAEAMAPARAVYEAANREEKAAWADLFNERPTTLPGVQMLLWHAGRWASENDGLSGVLNVTEVFEHIGDGLAGVLGSAAEELRRATAADAERKAFAVAAADMLDHDLVTEIWARAREMRPEAFAGVQP